MDAEDQVIILLPSLEDYSRSVTAEPEPSPPAWCLCSTFMLEGVRLFVCGVLCVITGNVMLVLAISTEKGCALMVELVVRGFLCTVGRGDLEMVSMAVDVLCAADARLRGGPRRLLGLKCKPIQSDFPMTLKAGDILGCPSVLSQMSQWCLSPGQDRWLFIAINSRAAFLCHPQHWSLLVRAAVLLQVLHKHCYQG